MFKASSIAALNNALVQMSDTVCDTQLSAYGLATNA
jgi:hypothetical protein